MIVVEATARIGEGDVEKLRPALEAIIEGSRAEPGCIDYAFAIDVLDPTLLRIIERWESADNLRAHFGTPHMKTFNDATKDIDIQDLSIRVFDAEPKRIKDIVG